MSVGVIPSTIASQPTGALQLLYENTVSGVASVDIATRNVPRQSGAIFQADYDEYVLDLINVVPGTTAVDGYFRVSTNGGVSYDSSNFYLSSIYVWEGGGTNQILGGALTSQWRIRATATISSAANYSLNGSLKFINPLSSTFYKNIEGGFTFWNSAALIATRIGGHYTNLTPVNACQFLFSSGTVNGTFRVYGLAKSSTAGIGPNILTDKVVQQVYTETGAVATGTTILPYDNTIPQNTEGDQYMSLAITPTNASNRLEIEVVFHGSLSIAQFLSVALFQDTTANALAAVGTHVAGATGAYEIVLRHFMTAGTTSATTFKVRAGGHLASTTTFNGLSGTGVFGGVCASSIKITEIVP